MDYGGEYLEQRAERLEREAADAASKTKEIENLCFEAMTLALRGGTPSRALWFWWRRAERDRGLEPS